MDVTRQLFWNINGKGFMYFAALAAFIIFSLGIFINISRWKRGRRVNYRIINISRVKKLLLHDKKIYKSRSRRFMHLSIFYGFFTLSVGTIVIAIQENFKVHLFYGPTYLILSLLLDLFGVLALIGIVMAVYKRYIKKRDKKNTADDAASLTLILIILLTGYLLEGLRIFATGDPWARWTPIGLTLALITQLSGLSISTAQSAYKVIWYGHMLLSFAFVAYIPYSKMFHMVASPLNVLLKTSSLGALTPVDRTSGETVNPGAARLEDFTQKQLIELDACLACFRCEKHCPAFESGAGFSPRILVQALKKHARQRSIKKNNDDSYLVGSVISREALLSCTSCGLCEEKCPVNLEHITRIIDLRRSLPAGSVGYPDEIRELFGKLSNEGNPWGVSAYNLNIPEIHQISVKKAADILYWTGCFGAHDSRNVQVTLAMIDILKKAGVDFAVTGPAGNCCGDTARRLGNEPLFQQLAQANIKNLSNYRFNSIVTACPHCYHTIKNEYPELGGKYQILHHSELIWQFIKSGKIRLKAKGVRKITFHDPCYLGRYNNVFSEPREILTSIPEVELAEMKNSRVFSRCCGAGGGQHWINSQYRPNISALRAQEAIRLKPDTIVSACPLCLTNLTNAIGSLEPDIKNLDIAEIIAEIL